MKFLERKIEKEKYNKKSIEMGIKARVKRMKKKEQERKQVK
jgi:hypothetical protein